MHHEYNRSHNLVYMREKKAWFGVLCFSDPLVNSELSICTMDDSMTVKVTHQHTCTCTDFAMHRSSKLYYNTQRARQQSW